MAYINAEEAGKKRKALKAAFPGWKMRVFRQHHSTLHVVIQRAPLDFARDYIGRDVGEKRVWDVNQHYLNNSWQGEALDALRRIIEIADEGNFDHSDAASDYFHVGFYLRVSVGDWQTPFELIEPKPASVEA